MRIFPRVFVVTLGLFAFCLTPAFAIISNPGTIYVSDWAHRAIQKIDPSGNAMVFASTGSMQALALGLDSSGSLYAATQANVIYKYDSFGNATLFSSADLNYATALAFDASGNLYAANEGSGAGQGFISKYDSLGNASVFAHTGAIQPTGGLAFDNDGNLYVALGGNATIEKYDSQGNGTLFAHVPSAYAMTFHDGFLYVATGFDQLFKLDLQGNAMLFASSGLSGCEGLAFGSDGFLYAQNGFNETITKFDAKGNPTLFATESFSMNAMVIQPVPEPAVWMMFSFAASAFFAGKYVRGRKTSAQKNV